MVVGNLTIAGCQIHYVVETDEVNFGKVTELVGDTYELIDSKIYNAGSLI